MDYYGLIGPLVRLLPAETAHHAALFALRSGLLPASPPPTNPLLQTQCFGLDFANPVGLAAGFDKNAEALDRLFAQGFGFVEAGTVTPLPQPGNPRPRMFRLEQDKAVINRLGFNNEGVHAFAANAAKRKSKGIFGANIGKNKDSLDAAYDYAACLEAVYPLADYITINISSPNTVGLRDLQHKDALVALMKTITAKREGLVAAGQPRKPILYKIAPDLTAPDMADIAQAALAHYVDGLIISNTTVSRPEHLTSAARQEKGGLSGRPLAQLALTATREFYRLTQGRIPLVGVGGIASAEDAYERIKAGASLVQLYTGLVYQGFGLVRRINEGLVRLLERDGFNSIKAAVGTK